MTGQRQKAPNGQFVSPYRQEMCREVYRLARLGYSQERIADALGIRRRSLVRWLSPSYWFHKVDLRAAFDRGKRERQLEELVTAERKLAFKIARLREMLDGDGAA
jgi:hypothetical protein